MAEEEKSNKRHVIRDFAQIRNTAREFYLYANRGVEELSNASDFSGKKRTILGRVALLKNLLKDYQGESYRHTFAMQDLIIFDPDRQVSPNQYYHERFTKKQTAVTGGEIPFININSRIRTHNPFFVLWKTYPINPNVALVYFAFLEALQDVEKQNRKPSPLRFKKSVSFDRPDKKNDNDNKSEDVSEINSLYDFLELNGIDFGEDTVRTEFNNLRDMKVFREVSNNMFLAGPRPRGISDDLLDFYSEVAPCGVIGSLISDKMNDGMMFEELLASDVDCFRFKHHYISHALDSSVLCRLLTAMHEHREVLLKGYISYKGTRRNYRKSNHNILPLRILSMVQTGRQYVVAYMPEEERFSVFRLDYIDDLKPGNISKDFQRLRDELDEMETHMWGASAQISRQPEELETVELIIRYDEDRFHLEKLQRECRCGKVEDLDDGRARFTAALYDSRELIPWIRTFTGRIESCHFSNPNVQRSYDSSVERMCEIYGV